MVNFAGSSSAPVPCAMNQGKSSNGTERIPILKTGSAEDALRASEQRLRLIVDSIPGLIRTMTAAGEVEVVSRQILEYFGKTLEELKGSGATEAVHPDDV